MPNIMSRRVYFRIDQFMLTFNAPIVENYAGHYNAILQARRQPQPGIASATAAQQGAG